MSDIDKSIFNVNILCVAQCDQLKAEYEDCWAKWYRFG